MKRYLSIFIVFAMLFVTSTAQALERVRPAYDQDTSTSPETKTEIKQKREALEAEMKARKLKKEEMEQRVKEAKDGIKTEMKDLKDQAIDKIDGLKKNVGEIKDKKKKELALKFMETRTKAFKGFNEALENVTKTKEKVEEKIKKAEDLGIDVTQAKANLVTVDTDISGAKAEILEAANLLSSKTTELSADDKTKLKSLAEDIRANLKHARTTLNDTVQLLKKSLKDYKASLRSADSQKNEGAQ